MTVASIMPADSGTAVGTGATIQAFTSQVTQNGVKALYDPQDPINDTYRGYIGEYHKRAVRIGPATRASGNRAGSDRLLGRRPTIYG